MVEKVETSQIVDAYNKSLYEIYKKENVSCLSDFDGVLFGSENALTLFSRCTEKAKNKYNINSHELLKLQSDLINSISGNIKFCIGNMILYKNSGLNDFNKEKIDINGKLTSTYHMNRSEQRYLLFASIGFEKLYNFWDRIGDLLDLCLNLGIQKKGSNVFFGKVIDGLSLKSTYLTNLKTFKDNDYEVLNQKRIRVVHYEQLETLVYAEWVKNMSDSSEMTRLQAEKESYLTELIKYNEYSIKGFEDACKLIEEQAK